jgi:hypothetical protein
MVFALPSNAGMEYINMWSSVTFTLVQRCRGEGNEFFF